MSRQKRRGVWGWLFFLRKSPVQRANRKLKRRIEHEPSKYLAIRNDPAYRNLMNFAEERRLRHEIGREVEEAMRMPPDPHDALTQAQTKPTRIIHNPFDPYRTQPLDTTGEEE
jgi:hypothetical protein